ncbi:MAG: beta-lactamase family protein [Desulfobacterales bacterium]|nr:beta-lactamase family protein [Desulfobacterales bacterium]
MKAFVYKTINVPKDLSKVTTYRLEDESPIEETGMTKEGKDAIWAGVEDYYRTGVHPSIIFCMRRKGKVVLNRAIGHAQGNGPDDSPDAKKILAKPETPVCMFSATKAVTAMLMHYLVEKKLINLTDPVSYYVPEFGAEGKENTTIYHVLSHQGGFPVISSDADPEILFDFDAAVKLLCKSKPASIAGRKISYHAITGGFILGELAKRVTGKNLREILAEAVQKPLVFKYFNYGVDDEGVDKVAINYPTGFPVVFPLSYVASRALGIPWKDVVRISNDKRFLTSIIPSANLVATADEICKFFQLLLNKGSLDGVRVFEPLTVKRAIMETSFTVSDNIVLIPMRYSAGMMLGSSPMSLMFGPFTEKAFGHWGFINMFCWADPERDISVALLNTGKPLVGPHLVKHYKLLSLISKYAAKINPASL